VGIEWEVESIRGWELTIVEVEGVGKKKSKWTERWEKAMAEKVKNTEGTKKNENRPEFRRTE